LVRVPLSLFLYSVSQTGILQGVSTIQRILNSSEKESDGIKIEIEINGIYTIKSPPTSSGGAVSAPLRSVISLAE
jgi:hypothetical protein